MTKPLLVASAALACGLALGASGCISGEGPEPTGSANILPGSPVLTADYEQGVAPVAGAGAPLSGQAAPAAPSAGVPSAPAGTAGAAAPTDPAAPVDPAAPIDPVAPVDSAVDPATDPAASPGDPVDPAVQDPAPAVSSSPGTLNVSFTSVDLRGRYSPRNCGAVWIETGTGTFVKTLERWCGIRAGDLRTWNAASGGWGFSFFGLGGGSADQLDAVTAATLRSHQAHTVTWDMIDNNEAEVPDGAYRVAIEVADGSHGATYIDFQKGPSPVDISVPSQSPVSNFTLTYTR